ncbi:MAG: tyrosine-type recombinase/integrase [Acidobacteriaceae bacterium]
MCQPYSSPARSRLDSSTIVSPPPNPQRQALVARVLANCNSAETRRAYGHALENFFYIHNLSGQPPLTPAFVVEYRRWLLDAGKSASTINVHLAAIKALVRQAAKDARSPDALAMPAAFENVRSVPVRGRRQGNWLTREQAQEMLSLPDRATLKGKRDYALLAVLLGCALRRTELVSEVRVDTLQQRENRWVLIDLLGRGRRTRTVAVPAWVKAALHPWIAAVGNQAGKIFRALRKNGAVWGEGLTAGAMFQVVRLYAERMGLAQLAPHDLRRTCAKLCRKRGGDLEQIKFLLGHESIQTTERYLGAEQDLVTAVNDKLGLER